MKKIARKYLRLDMNLERVLFLFICQFYYYRIAINFIVSKNKPPKKKNAGTWTIISILSRNFEADVLTVWKNKSMLMKP